MTTSTPDSIPMRSNAPGSTHRPRRLLRDVFAVDRVLSAVSAVAAIAGAAPIADWLGWPTWTLIAVGGALVANTALIQRVCAQLVPGSGSLPGASAKASVVVDLATAAGIAALLIGATDVTSEPGRWLLGAAALGIAAIGVLKAIGLTRA